MVLHLQQLGLPDPATKRSVKLDHNMRQYVKTKDEVTPEFYKHTKRYAKYREGQCKISPLLHALQPKEARDRHFG
eukprot:5494241-Ditylum_brightwellii.AAC.1